MQVQVPLENGFLADEYTKFASDADKIAGKPAKSFPISIKNIPAGTQSLAIYFKDFDSVPVCGFVWIHWLAANIPTVSEIPADASRNKPFNFIQGANSNVSKLLPKLSGPQLGYTGPQPPTGVHDYELTVYALDNNLELEDGYYLNEFLEKIDGHIIDKENVILPAKAEK
ncbi:Raf kinase inhibitor-like YbhB/YbcL family protein [Lactobacillus colini]|uniref:Raf kinase inhibitor-like YbhB/YbcL family protein n=1 Tax=Lactobacillus colini TaxID=1819254 RepID=A0ABS4MFE5_9LACO|nr:YbhB/YbcL family Raf kinase inhibitor-like protein [Lactobacillus colini]MBP2058404.1 Raf kinase inhibitor-like YbhB/YbcL family protein [Lactobacillus colini]